MCSEPKVDAKSNLVHISLVFTEIRALLSSSTQTFRSHVQFVESLAVRSRLGRRDGIVSGNRRESEACHIS